MLLFWMLLLLILLLWHPLLLLLLLLPQGLFEKYEYPLMYTSPELNAATEKLIACAKKNDKILGMFQFGTDRSVWSSLQVPFPPPTQGRRRHRVETGLARGGTCCGHTVWSSSSRRTSLSSRSATTCTTSSPSRPPTSASSLLTPKRRARRGPRCPLPSSPSSRVDSRAELHAASAPASQTRCGHDRI